MSQVLGIKLNNRLSKGPELLDPSYRPSGAFLTPADHFLFTNRKQVYTLVEKTVGKRKGTHLPPSNYRSTLTVEDHQRNGISHVQVEPGFIGVGKFRNVRSSPVAISHKVNMEYDPANRRAGWNSHFNHGESDEIAIFLSDYHLHDTLSLSSIVATHPLALQHHELLTLIMSALVILDNNTTLTNSFTEARLFLESLQRDPVTVDMTPILGQDEIDIRLKDENGRSVDLRVTKSGVRELTSRHSRQVWRPSKKCIVIDLEDYGHTPDNKYRQAQINVRKKGVNIGNIAWDRAVNIKWSQNTVHGVYPELAFEPHLNIAAGFFTFSETRYDVRDTYLRGFHRLYDQAFQLL